MEKPAQVYFEDVAEGMELPSEDKAPLTVTDLVRFASASGDYALIHHDREYAKNVAGLPDIILHGQGKIALMSRIVTDWMGVRGQLRRLAAQYRGLDIVGDTVETSGKVVRKYTKDGENLIELELQNQNQRAGVTATGTATVALPSRKRRRKRG
jgi:acyl dehydratase